MCINLENARSPKFTLRTMRKTLITLSKTDEEMVIFELMIRSKLRHPFLINQVSAFQDYDNLYYINEYAPVLLLNSPILPRKFSCEITKFYAAEAFLCLKYLHSKGQNYTFLSPKNVCLAQDGHLKLDYTFCNCIECSSNGILDDVEYFSPDYLDNNRFSYLTDYWSLGVIIYQMIHGYAPFSGSSVDFIIAEIKKCNVTIQEPVDEDTDNMINMLIDCDLGTKFSTCEMLEDAIMKHSFFNEIDWDKMLEKEIEPPFSIRLPEYDVSSSPRLNLLYTTDFIGGEKDGYGNLFRRYNTIHFLKHRKHHRKVARGV